MPRATLKRARRAGRAASANVRAAVRRVVDEAAGDTEDVTFSSLQWMTAGIFLVAGADAVLRERKSQGRVTELVRWAPLLAAPLAGAAHAARALSPNRKTRVAAQVLDGLAMGVAAAGVGRVLYEAATDGAAGGPWTSGPRHRARALSRTVAPLTFGATGVLGLILDREERDEEAELRRLRRRARVVERLVPKRRPRLDHIVVHI
jgi:hypothetical protein